MQFAFFNLHFAVGSFEFAFCNLHSVAVRQFAFFNLHLHLVRYMANVLPAWILRLLRRTKSRFRGCVHIRLPVTAIFAFALLPVCLASKRNIQYVYFSISFIWGKVLHSAFCTEPFSHSTFSRRVPAQRCRQEPACTVPLS